MKTIDDNNDTLVSLINMLLSLTKQKKYAFRGQADYENSLTPGIYRNLHKDFEPPIEIKADYEWLDRMERDLYREFISKGRGVYSNEHIRDHWETLFFGQHHGLPTRLLDWTTEFFVAIYFAVSDQYDKDGAIWLVNVTDFPHPGILGRLPKEGAFRMDVIKEHIATNKLRLFIMGTSQYIVSLPGGSAVGTNTSYALPSDQSKDGEKSGFLTFVQSPDIDQRIRSQKGIFSIYLTYSESDIVLDHAAYIEHLEKSYGIDLLTKIRIPAQKKESIKYDLKELGKDPFSIYPDLPGLIYLLKDERNSTVDFYKEDRKRWSW